MYKITITTYFLKIKIKTNINEIIAEVCKDITFFKCLFHVLHYAKPFFGHILFDYLLGIKYFSFERLNNDRRKFESLFIYQQIIYIENTQ